MELRSYHVSAFSRALRILVHENLAAKVSRGVAALADGDISLLVL